MTISVHGVRTVPKAASVRVALVTSDSVEAGIDGFDAGHLQMAGFEGKADQVYQQPAGGRIEALVGVGSTDSVDARAIRRSAATAARSFGRHERIALRLPSGAGIAPAAARQAAAEGAILGSYRYTAFKSVAGGPNGSDGATRLKSVNVLGCSSEAAKAHLRRGSATAQGVCLARDLVNEPGGSLTPPAFAQKAAAAAAEAGLEFTVWTETDIERERLGGLLGVNRGSTQPPRFVQITYEPEGTAAATLAFVGKGLTFDAGGLSIKTAQGMMTMKMDMGGAAAVIGAMSVLPAVGAPARVLAFLPMTDNMLGGDATRPGDVLTIRNGKTIEVANTDAEGRLVLADALSLASEANPDAIVDLATLTGACMVALGPRIAGLMGNDQPLLDRVRAAADTAGERVWPLPLPADYEKQFESNVADMKNIGGPHGGALTAGLILQKFVAEGVAWAHLDIAGPAYSESDDGEFARGGTGFGVRTLVELAVGYGETADAD